MASALDSLYARLATLAPTLKPQVLSKTQLKSLSSSSSSPGSASSASQCSACRKGGCELSTYDSWDVSFVRRKLTLAGSQSLCQSCVYWVSGKGTKAAVLRNDATFTQKWKHFCKVNQQEQLDVRVALELANITYALLQADVSSFAVVREEKKKKNKQTPSSSSKQLVSGSSSAKKKRKQPESSSSSSSSSSPSSNAAEEPKKKKKKKKKSKK
jgi:hypothetical protein